VTGVGRYREFPPPPELRALVACLWQNDADRTTRIVPDGCVDLVWHADHSLFIAGADTGPVLWAGNGEPAHGIRLRPGAAGAVLGVPATEVTDQRVPINEIWPEAHQIDRGPGGINSAARMSAMADLVRGRAAEPDPLVRAAAHVLASAEIRVAAAADDLGVSERTLNRRVTAAVGYGPKTLARVARLRRLQNLTEGQLALRAVLAGYASQAHMNAEVRQLTGLTPTRFLVDRTPTAA
jgi:AraC-like DNA-binding protein